MSNGDDVIVCCLLGLCCPAGSARQREAAVKMIRHQRPNWSKDRCERAADKLLEKFNNFEGMGELIDAS